MVNSAINFQAINQHYIHVKLLSGLKHNYIYIAAYIS